ncbi:MAG: phosphotransferase [Pseudomonadota bacterium]
MSIEQITRTARRVATEHYGFSNAVELDLLGYRENAVYSAREPDAGTRIALRLHQQDFHSAQEIASELVWMDRLRLNGVDTPRVVRARDGQLVCETVDEQGRAQCVSALAWVEGAPPSDDRMIEAYEKVGAIAARIHADGREWVTPPGFSRWTIDERTAFGEVGLWGDYGRVSKLDDDQKDLFDQAGGMIRSRLLEFGKAPDRFGLIHGDLMTENIMVEGSHSRVIDFDDCGYGWHLYDLATALFIHAGGDLYEPLRDSWIEGYHRVSAIPDEHLDMVDTLVLARILGLVGWQARFPNHPVTLELGDWVIAHAESFSRAYLP